MSQPYPDRGPSPIRGAKLRLLLTILVPLFILVGAFGAIFGYRYLALPPRAEAAPAALKKGQAQSQTPVLGFEEIDLTADWLFKPDPKDQGADEGWEKVALADSSWDAITGGNCWEDLGYPGYDGLGWYRKSFVAPEGWQGRPIYFWFSGVDDEFDFYLNDQKVGHYGDKLAQVGVSDARFTVEISKLLRPGQKNVIALRVSDWHGDGGLCKQPILLSTSDTERLDERQYIERLARARPDWVWPKWAVGEGKAWTVAGLAGGPAVIVGHDGSVSPGKNLPSLNFWLFDQDRQKLLAPERLPVEQRLQDGYQPVPITRWRDGELEVETTVLVTDSRPVTGRKEELRRLLGLVSSAEGEPTALWRVEIRNLGSLPHRVAGIVVARPFGPNGTVRPIRSAEATANLGGSPDSLYLDDRLVLLADTPASGVGFAHVGSEDISAYLGRSELPFEQSGEDSQGLGTIGLEYPLTLAGGESRVLTFKLPLGDGMKRGGEDKETLRRVSELRYDAESVRTRALWQSKLQRVGLEIPEERYRDAFYASLGYLLVNMRGEYITSGPYAHNAMWYRDAAYIVPAFLKAGITETAPGIIDQLALGQLQSGEFPTALNVTGEPKFHERHEWDAQGEFIYTIAEKYRLTKDRKTIESAWSAIERGAEFGIALADAQKKTELEGTPLWGLLPPSDSAEDIGPREWRHYWDEFWLIGGLDEAAFIADELGKIDVASRYHAKARERVEIVEKSVTLLMAKEGIDYIPNGPDDPKGSSMARGTTPAVWPLRLYREMFTQGARSDLFLRSFEEYFKLWVEPHGYAYQHNSGNYWPYAGLGLAHAYLYLGEAGRAAHMLGWVMDNQTSPGTFAWGEAVEPESKRFAGGDMPHSWAASEYVLYIRDSFLREADGGWLVLADGVPAPWLQPGKTVGIHKAPTYFGEAGFTISASGDGNSWELKLDEGVKAPAGYILRGPFPKDPKRLVVDGKETLITRRPIDPSFKGGPEGIELPSGARVVRIEF